MEGGLKGREIGVFSMRAVSTVIDCCDRKINSEKIGRFLCMKIVNSGLSD